MTLILPSITSPSITTSPSIPAFTITDGVDLVLSNPDGVGAWDTAEEAAEVMRDLCWHPRMFAGPFRVVPCTLRGVPNPGTWTPEALHRVQHSARAVVLAT